MFLIVSGVVIQVKLRVSNEKHNTLNKFTMLLIDTLHMYTFLVKL